MAESRRLVVALRGIPARLPVSWTYFGLSERPAGLTDPNYVSCADALTATGRAAKPDFIAWMDRIGTIQEGSLNWWASTLASRSPLQTDCFVLTMYSELLQVWLRDRSAPVACVVTDDPWLWLALRRQHRDGDIRFAGNPLRLIVSTVSHLARGVKAMIYVWLWTVGMILRVLVTRTGASGPAARHDTLVHTWIGPRTFTNGETHDPYLGDLCDLLERAGKRVGRLTPVVFDSKLLVPLRGQLDRFIVTPAYLRWSDALVATARPFRVRELKKAGTFRGRDCRPLLVREMLVAWSLPWHAQNLLWHQAVCRVAREGAAGVRSLIYSFENQPWEKLLCLAFRQHAPQVRLIGSQTAGIPELLLGFSLAPGEESRAPLPDVVVANGRKSRELLALNNFSESRLAIGGALRFEHLHAESRPPLSARRAVVALPIARRQSVLAVRELQAALSEPLLMPGQSDPIVFSIVGHPLMPIRQIVDVAAWPPWMELVEAPLLSQLHDAGVCLFVAPTGAWREAFFRGVPILKYRPDCLDLDPIDTLGEVLLPACDRRSVRIAVHSVWGRPPAPDRGTIMEQVFAPVAEAVWRDVLVLD